MRGGSSRGGATTPTTASRRWRRCRRWWRFRGAPRPALRLPLALPARSSEASQRLDLSADGSEISGALSDELLRESDLSAGRYEAASIATWLADWSDPSLRLLTACATLGEVRREGQAFTAELRGLADRLSQDSGRLYTATCGADVGDARCRVAINHPTLRGTGSVIAAPGNCAITAAGLDGYAAGLFTAGRLSWTSGANSGSAVEVKQHRVVAGGAAVAVAGDGRADRGRRRVRGDGGLRQAAGDLPRPLRQHRQLPRLPADSGQRLRGQLSDIRRAGNGGGSITAGAGGNKGE